MVQATLPCGAAIVRLLGIPPSGRSKATFQGIVRFFFFSYLFYRICMRPRMSILVFYRVEDWKGPSFCEPVTKQRLEPGSSDLCTGIFSWSHWLGWSCSAFQISVYLDVFKWEDRSFKEMWLWVSSAVVGLCPLLQKHLSRHL